MALAVQNLGLCPYDRALVLQEALVGRKLAGEATDYLLLLEHPPVYTLGRGADAGDLQEADRLLGVPVFRVSRGGGVTFHGPGQLVAYPIIALGRGGRDVHRYVRRLEDVLIGTCADFGVAAERQVGRTGVWVGDAKIASIGVGVRRWTTFHGVALNVSTELRYFGAIVPCRMPEVRMTSLSEQLGVVFSVTPVAAAFEQRFREVFAYEQSAAVVEDHP